MWQTGWCSTNSQESIKKNQHEQVGTQNRAAQLSRARRGQRHRWTGHSTVRRNANPLNTSRNQKRYKEKGPTPEKRKAITLTSHAAAMDLMIELPGNRVVPRQCLGPIAQFFMRASPEQGAQTILAQRQVPQGLQHVEQHGDGYRVQHNR